MPAAIVSHHEYYLQEISAKLSSRMISVQEVNSTSINIILHPPRDMLINLFEQLTLVYAKPNTMVF